MNDTTELPLAPTGTELSVIERAKLALASSHTEAVLTELAKKYMDVTTIRTKTDYQIVMGALGEFRRHRNSVERTGKLARDDANKYSKAVITEQNRLVGIIEPEEIRLAAIRKVWDDEQERIRLEAEEKEEARKDALRMKVFSFERLVALVAGKPSEEVQEAIRALNTIVITSTEFQDFTRQAEGALIAAKDQAARLLAETLERERHEEEALAALAAEAKRQRLEASELARQREENERAAAEMRTQQAAIRKEQQAETARLEQARAEVERQREEAAAELARLEQARAEVERRRQEAPTIQPEAAPQPTLAADLEGWKARHKVAGHVFEELLAILASHQV